MKTDDDRVVLDAMSLLALEAGARQMAVYASDFQHGLKDDASPVTEADRLGEEIILAGLRSAFPATPILAEEEAASAAVPHLGSEFFLVDPLDGTKEFISRNGEFTVNIALIRDGRPVIGVVYAPALGKLFEGGLGIGARRRSVDAAGGLGPCEKITTRKPPPSGLVAVASRSHRSPETDDFLKTLNVADFATAGSSLKFCLIAEGSADVYPRLGRTMEWDTGAGQAVLEAAGGVVLIHGCETPLRYGKQDRGFDNPSFVAWGAPAPTK
jgi:3'(2'),5'-bisphosphate nucleotidase